MSASRPIILVVDDDPDARDILCRLLTTLAAHTEVIAVVSGMAALDALAAHPVALVIADYHMPSIDGATLAKRIKAISPTTPVVLMSVDDSNVVMQRANAAAAKRPSMASNESAPASPRAADG